MRVSAVAPGSLIWPSQSCTVSSDHVPCAKHQSVSSCLNSCFASICHQDYFGSDLLLAGVALCGVHAFAFHCAGALQVAWQACYLTDSMLTLASGGFAAAVSAAAVV